MHDLLNTNILGNDLKTIVWYPKVLWVIIWHIWPFVISYDLLNVHILGDDPKRIGLFPKRDKCFKNVLYDICKQI